MEYEIINENTAVIFAKDTDTVLEVIANVAETLNLKYAKLIKDHLPFVDVKDERENTISQFFLIKVGEEEPLQEQSEIIPVETTEVHVDKPAREMTDAIVGQYQQGLKYANKALSDIINEFNNEIVLRELLLNTFKEGKSTLDLGSGVIQPLIPKALRGKTQKPFTPYGKGSKKHVKDFLKSNSDEIQEDDPLVEETMQQVDRFFNKMQRGLSKKDRGGIGIASEEEAARVEEEQNIFENGKEVLLRMKSMISYGVLGSPKNFYGEDSELWQQAIDTLFSLVQTTYMIFAEQKYEYRDDMATYLQVTSEKAKQFTEEYQSLIAFFESIVPNI